MGGLNLVDARCSLFILSVKVVLGAVLDFQYLTLLSSFVSMCRKTLIEVLDPRPLAGE